LLLHRVLAPIELNYQFGFRAAKISDEGIDGMLAAEPCTA